MKKIILLLLSLVLITSVDAQVIRANSNHTLPFSPDLSPTFGIPEMWDGHTKAMYIYDTAITVVSDHVTQWNDISGNNNHLLPYATDGSAGTVSNRPTWHATDGVIFDGVDDVLRVMISGWTTFGSVYAVVRQVSWTDNDVLFGYAGTGSVRVAEDNTAEGASPNIHLIHSSGSSLAITTLPIGTWGLITLHVNGATSTATIELNNGTPITNSNSMSGFTSGGVLLGAAHAAYPALQRWGNVAILCIIYRDIIDGSTDELAFVNWIQDEFDAYL
jgi:hypothetical protein